MIRFNPRHLATVMVLLFVAAPAVAQLRFATGNFIDRWQVFEPPGLTTTINTPGGRVCGPGVTAMQAAACAGQVYPFLGGGQNVAPIHPDPNATTGATMTTPVAVVSAGLGLSDPVYMPLASEWQYQGTGMIPSGFIPGVVSIWTFYDGRNARAVSATGMGLVAGGGPGNFVFNPLNTTQGTPAVFSGMASHPTLSFPSGNDPGSTTSPGQTINVNFLGLNPVPTTGVKTTTLGAGTATTPNQFGAIYTAGPRQFGGTAAILSDTPNRLTLSFPGGTLFQRTNGKCRAGIPFGDCQVGFRWGTDFRATSVRRNQNQTVPSVFINEFDYWHGNLWTTGTVTVRNYQEGDDWESFAQSGLQSTTPSGARHLVLVSPILNYRTGLAGIQEGGAHIGIWDMTIQTPEPASALGLIAGMGALFGLHARARRRA